MAETNDNLVLIGGESSGGKTASLRNLKNPEGIMYLNCESNKKCPFPAKFQQFSIIDPYQVYEGFEYADKNQGEFHTIIIDTLTFLMDMFESIHVLPAKDTMKGWSNYGQFFKNLMQKYVAKSKCNVIILAHVRAIMNEAAMIMEKKVPVKGALQANGIEALESSAVI